MNIYIEYVLIDNFVITYLFLYLTSKILKSNLNSWRLAIASFVGAIFAVVQPLVDFQSFYLLAYKLLVGLLIVVICIKTFHIRKIIFTYATFLLVTFVCGGTMYGLIISLGGNVAIDYYSINFPVGFVVLFIFGICYLFGKLSKYIFRSERSSNVYEVFVSVGNYSSNLKLYLDTGNSLKCNKNNLPVVVIGEKNLCPLFDKSQRNLMMIGLFSRLGLKDFDYINYGTVSNSCSKLPVFRPDNFSVKIDGIWKEKGVMIGITNTSFSSNNVVAGLISPQALKSEVV